MGTESLGPQSPVSELRGALERRELSAVTLTERTLASIARTDATIGAWLRTADESALEAAADIDARRSNGETLGPLAGIPVGIKDMICTQGLKTTAASKMLANFVPPYDATVITRLRAADAIPIGKLNQDEFAMGSSNENSAFGAVRNPWDHARVPGGSSGGSAAAIAAGQVPLTLGTDTGGSIRQPASFCGVVGFKPTYGRVSRYGVVAFASSLDQVGPLAANVEDATALLEVLCGHDPLDSTSLPGGPPALLAELERDITGLRVGVPAEYFGEGLDAQVEDSVRAALSGLESQGAQLVPITLPHTSYAVATYYVIATAEASSNLSRYDGVRYTHRTDRVEDLKSLYGRSRSEGFGPEVKRRIILGTYALSSGYYDAYYLKAQQVRTLIIEDFQRAFEGCDVIAAPVAPTTAFVLGERTEDPLQMYLQDILTIPASLAGLPCGSIPCGLDSRGLPVGMQLIAPALHEATLVRASAAVERHSGFANRRPGGGEA
jgi:aspartyl-tRNA(Asn)/glutamyl-tRNA(Gln) amidotransferase subunit A